MEWSTIALPRLCSGKESACQCKSPGFDPWVRKIPWGRKWHLTLIFLHGKLNRQRSLEGYSSWGHKELDTTEQLTEHTYTWFSAVQFSSVTQSCLTLWDPMDCSIPGLPVHHQFPELTPTHGHQVGNAIQPSHPLLSPSPPAFNIFQHQGLFQWVSSSHQVAKVLEFQIQHQSFQWLFRTAFL